MILLPPGQDVKSELTVGRHLKNSIDIINPEKLRDSLKTSYIGRKILYFPSIESTNTMAVELSKKGESEGTVVIADEQTRGKGRLGRQWLGAANKNILMSVIFRPQLETNGLFYITMLTSAAIVKAIKKTTGIKADIKWPNDIYIGNKKAAGILTEMDAGEGRTNYVVVGIGLNVNFNPSDYPEIREIATSLLLEGGREYSRARLLTNILEEIEKRYDLLKNGKFGRIYGEWKRSSIILGRHVKILLPGHTVEGIAESVGPDGTLILALKDGSRRQILSGDVSLRFSE